MIEFNDAQEEVFRKMFEIAGVEFDGFVFTKDWYTKHEITETQEDEFWQWLVEKLKNRSFYKKLNGGICHSTSKKTRTYMAEMFILHYGWKRKK